MNRINEIGDTPRGQKALGAVFARAHNRKNWCDKNMVEPHRKDAKDYWQNVEHNASSEVGRNAKDKLKGFENFGAGAQEYYKNHLPNDTIQIPQHESKNGNMNKKLIRLTEQDLHRIVKESVNRVLNEDWESEFYDGKDSQLDKELQLAAQLAKEGDKVGAIRSLQDAIDIVRNYDNLRG